ncbi:executer 1 [Trifolium repens]|nr:executer 1 [Trifolium repens]
MSSEDVMAFFCSNGLYKIMNSPMLNFTKVSRKKLCLLFCMAFRAKFVKVGLNILFLKTLGVDKIYKGQAKVAEIGCKNPRWIDGELFMFNGKVKCAIR